MFRATAQTVARIQTLWGNKMDNSIVAQKQDPRQDARTLAAWLMLPPVEHRHHGAYLRGCFLLILADSCTPDTEELIAEEIAEIKAIMGAQS